MERKIREELQNELIKFVKKATSKNARDVEVKVLPEVAKVLSELIFHP